MDLPEENGELVNEFTRMILTDRLDKNIRDRLSGEISATSRPPDFGWGRPNDQATTSMVALVSRPRGLSLTLIGIEFKYERK